MSEWAHAHRQLMNEQHVKQPPGGARALDAIGGMLSNSAGYYRFVKIKERNRLRGNGQCENAAFYLDTCLLGWLDDLEGSNVNVELLGRGAQRERSMDIGGASREAASTVSPMIKKKRRTSREGARMCAPVERRSCSMTASATNGQDRSTNAGEGKKQSCILRRCWLLAPPGGS